jgi:RNA polymerase sigma-70 factor (ECF subfamily)
MAAALAVPAAADTASSWALVAAAQQGNRDAFGRLYARYLPVVAGFLRRRVRDHGLVEDLTSETFARAWRAIGSVRDQGRDVGAWFLTIARNLVRDHVRSHRVQREALTADVEALALADVAVVLTSADGVERVVLARLAAAELGRRVAALPAGQREVIRLRFEHGLSARQVADRLGRSEGAVKALQHRAITRLRGEPDCAGGGER